MKNMVTVGLSIITASLLVGCGGGGGSSETPDNSNPDTGGLTKVGGDIVLGKVHDASISLVGFDGKKYATAKTDSEGHFEFDVNLTKKMFYKIISDGGKYKSEADTDGAEKDAGRLCALLSIEPSSDLDDIVVSALTTYACEYVGDSSDDVDTKIKDAYKKLAEIFGLSTEDFINVLPELSKEGLAKGDIASRVAILYGMFEEMATRLGLAPSALYAILAEDFSDGEFDGKAGAKDIDGASTTPYSDFLASLDAYRSRTTGTELADKGLVDDATDSDALKGITKGLVTFAPASSGVNVSSSGAVATLSFDSKQYVYVAGRDKGLVGFDITNPDKPLNVDLSALNSAISTKGLSSVGGIVAIPAKADPIVMVYAYDNQNVLFVDLNKKEVIKKVEVKVSARQGFSGGAAYISSGIADSVHHGVWLATTDGYWFVDTDSMTAALAPVGLANGEIISENIGADISQEMLFSPNYGSGYGGGGLQLVDTENKKAYALDSDAWSNTIGTLAGMYSADAGAVDGDYHIGVIMPEDTSYIGFIDLSDMSKYSFVEDKDGNATFNAKDGDISKLVTSFNLNSLAGGSAVLSNVAIDSQTHLMLLSAGYSTTIGVAKLEAPSKDGSWNPISKRAYYNGQYGEYSYAEDPHAAGVVNSISNGKSYGYILSSDGYVLQIDMEAFLDSKVKDATGETDNAYTLESSPFEKGGSIKRLEIK